MTRITNPQPTGGKPISLKRLWSRAYSSVVNWPTRLWRGHRGWALFALALVGLGTVVVLIWPLTDVIAAHDVSMFSRGQRALHMQSARETARGQLLTLGAGVFAAGALFYTARSFALSRRTYQLTEQGQVTDRYTRAIEQLGADKVDVRIGGIYALERVARDSARDHQTVMEVLASFIRDHSKQQRPRSQDHTDPAAHIPKRLTRPDVFAAITVFGRRNYVYDRMLIDLTDVDLAHVNLFEPNLHAKLNGANFSGAKLFHADFGGAELNGADFTGADLSWVDFTQAYLCGAAARGARLWFTDFTGTQLDGADLTGQDFRGLKLTDASFRNARLADADFDNTDLAGVDLNGADLRGAHFRYADLARLHSLNVNDPSGADFEGALYAADVPTPKGWVRDPGSSRLRPAVGDSSD